MQKRLMLLLLLLLLPQRVAAQNSPVTWTVIPGYNGTFKAGAWIPITITVANSGSDLRGRVEWRWQTGASRFAQSVDLPRGAKKQIVLPAVANSRGGDATVELYSGTTAVASEEHIHFNQVDVNTLVIGVLSDMSNALAELAGISSNQGSSTTLLHLGQADLPERWELLQSFDVLFVHDTDSSTWSDAQRTAVAQWVADGGQLIVGGDRTRTAAGIGALLPATVTEPARPARLAALSAKLGWKPRDPAASVQALRLKPQAGAQVLAADGDMPLLVRRSYGGGQVIQATFDLQALNTQGNAVPLWERLIIRGGPPPEWSQLQSNAQWVLQQSIALPALRLPSIWELLGFLALYIGLVGPANYLILRRLDRREWAYVTVPLTVALFTAGAYGVGARGRGGSASATALTIARAAPGSTTGEALSYLGIYSPVRRSYRVGLGQEALVRDGLDMVGLGRQPMETRRTESAVEVPALFIDVGEMRPLNVQQTTPVPDVRASIQHGGGQSTIEIENRSSQPLVDVALVAGQSLQKLEDLRPGERRAVQFKPEMGGTPDEAGFHSGGVIKRGAALRALQSFAFDAEGPPPEKGPGDAVQPAPAPGQTVQLVAWSSDPNIQVALDGAPADVKGDTVYLWSLGKLSP